MYDPYAIIGWAWGAVAIVWLVSSFISKRTAPRAIGSLAPWAACPGCFRRAVDLRPGPLERGSLTAIISQNPASANLRLALTLAGILFALWARFVIGRNWSGTVTIKHDHELVRSGPYAIVRHPIYSGFLLALFGTVIAHGTAGAFLALAMVILVLRLKSLTEESFMLEQFGPQYTAYMREVQSAGPICLVEVSSKQQRKNSKESGTSRDQTARPECSRRHRVCGVRFSAPSWASAHDSEEAQAKACSGTVNRALHGRN